MASIFDKTRELLKNLQQRATSKPIGGLVGAALGNPIRTTHPNRQPIGQMIGQALQRTPVQQPRIIAPQAYQSRGIDLSLPQNKDARLLAEFDPLRNQTNMYGDIMRSFGNSLTNLSSPQGRQKIVQGAKQLVTTRPGMNTLSNPAVELALNVTPFLSGKGKILQNVIPSVSGGLQDINTVRRNATTLNAVGRIPKPDPRDVAIVDKIGELVHNKAASKDSLRTAIKYLDDLAEVYLKKAEVDKVKGNPNKILKLLQRKFANADVAPYEQIPGLGFAGTPSLDKITQGAARKIEDYKLNKAQENFNVPKPPSTEDYIKELTAKKDTLKKGSVASLKQRGSNFLKDIKAKLVDSTSPIEDAVTEAEKRNKFKVLPKQDVRLQIDRVLRSKTLASQFADDNGITNVIKNAPDLEALDQYLIAKHAARVEQYGKKTGRDLVRDKQLIDDLAPQYEEHAKAINQYGQKLLDYAVDRGLVDKKLADYLKKRYPEYVPLQRVFDEMEKATPYQGSTKAVASLSKQTVVQKLEGSERTIESPLESLLLKTQTAFEQGEKNVAAKQLASYRTLPGLKELVKELPAGESAAHTFSYLENGVKKTFATTPEIAAAAKNLNKEQMNIVLKILSVPTRVLQLGATGLNAPFAVTNLAKDQMTAFINSNKVARTSMANPANFVKAMFAAFKHDDLYDEVVRNAAGGTSFDISRTAPNLSIKQIRSQRGKLARASYIARNPGELLRTLENMIGRTEEITRVQQYAGTKQALLKEGRTGGDAALLAAKAARENTANFYRKGDVGRIINYIIPFFNAGIQGSRSFVRALQTNPKGTGTKLTIGLFTPVAAATAWNLNDPERKKVYEDIQDYEKENNLIMVLPSTKLDENGRYNVVKIPIPPGLSNLASLVRRPMEQASGMDPVRFGEIANNLITAGTSLDFSSKNKLASTFTPQVTKPFIEDITNTNLFTGNKIVPDKMADLPPEAQARPNTSATARAIGKLPFVNASPLRVENFIKTAAAGAGSQVLATADKALALTGAIPPEQAQGEGPIGNLQRRFSQATGGQSENAAFEQYGDLKKESAKISYNRTQIAEKLISDIKAAPTREAKAQILKQTLSSVPKEEQAKVIEKLKDLAKDQAANVQPIDRALRSLPVQQRAKYIKEELSGKTREEKIALLKDWKAKGLLTQGVIEELKK